MAPSIADQDTVSWVFPGVTVRVPGVLGAVTALSVFCLDPYISQNTVRQSCNGTRRAGGVFKQLGCGAVVVGVTVYIITVGAADG